MKILLNKDTIIYAHSISRQMEFDVNKNEISKTITLRTHDLKITIICTDVYGKHALWELGFNNKENFVDLTKPALKQFIEGLELD